MNNAQEKVEWVLKFAGMDVKQFREGDWLNLVADMSLFIGEENARIANQVREPGVLDEIQGKAMLILGTIAERNSPKSGLALRKGLKERLTIDARHEKMLKNSGILAENAETVLVISPQAFDELIFNLSTPGRFRLTATASQLRPAFEFALGVALMGVDVSRLRSCYAPQPRQHGLVCRKRFFASHGRQEFCSSQCKNRAALQRFRESHQSNEDREAERERGRRNYHRKT